MTTTQIITQESLKEWFDFDGVTLSWKDKTRETKICKNAAGYAMIRYAGNARLVHRLVFIMIHGYEPKQIDHIDGNPANYSISNLRDCGQSENGMNKVVQSNSKSGLKGVFWDKAFKRWVVCVQKNGKKIRVVQFPSAEDAYEFACLLREVVHGQFANHGTRGI
jgi:hypothetical protein